MTADRRRWQLSEAPDPQPLPVRILLWLTVATMAAFVGLLLVQGPGTSFVRDTVLYGVVQWATALLVLARGVIVARERMIWLALGAGMALAAGGDLLWSTSIANLGDGSGPTIADAFYLAFYPGCYLALVLIMRLRVTGLPRSLWLDGLTAALALGGVLAALVYGPVAAGADGSPLALATALAYPLLDALLVALVVGGLVVHGARPEPRLTALAIALSVTAVADIVYSLQAAAGTYVEGTWLDALWPLSNLVLASIAWHRDGRPSERPAPDWLVLTTPVVSLLVAVTTLLVAARVHLPTLALVLEASAMVALLVRLTLTQLESRGLVATAERLAWTDSLTGLPNRLAFTQAAERHLAESARLDDGPVALLLADLDNFKDVNDSLGHAAGDELLTDVANRLSLALRSPVDVLSRFGGDEFAILLPGADGPAAEAVCRRIEVALAGPSMLDGVRTSPRASIGIAVAPGHGTELPLLLRRADIAMYRAKASRTGHARYDATLGDPDGEDRLQRLDALRGALSRGELVVHYQPKIALGNGVVTDVEALVRWDRPGVGMVPPRDFLPLMEAAGLMPKLTAVVLRSALGQVASWRADGLDLGVAVNLPAAALVDADLPVRVAAALVHHGVVPGRLSLEITENSLLTEHATARGVIARLRAAGVRLSIDDYGSGYSSLAYLSELPVDELKLDRSFVHAMASDDRSAAIVRSTIDLAHSLGLSIVAEGVESAEVAAALASFGCDLAQGYHYTRPLPADELTRWVRAWRGSSLDPSQSPDPDASQAQTVSR